MRIDHMVEELKQEVVIPEIVQRKARDAFSQIQQEVKSTNDSKKVRIFYKRRKTRLGKQAAVFAVVVCASAAAAAVVYASSATVSAKAYHIWSQSLKRILHISEVEQELLEKNAVSDHPLQSVEDAGVKVTSVQSIVDNRFAYLAFQVDGYDFSKNTDTGFDEVNVWIDGKFANNYGGSFDGNEYCMLISPGEDMDTVIGKEVRVEFSGLGSCEKAEVQGEVDGRWELSWTLQGSDELAVYQMEEALGDSGAIVTKAEISPISLNLIYHMPRKTVEEPYYDETNQQKGIATFYAEPPGIAGIKMKDGNIYTGIVNGGSEGYLSKDSDLYRVSVSVSQMIDSQNVQALLFWKENSGQSENEKLTEDMFYEVPIG